MCPHDGISPPPGGPSRQRWPVTASRRRWSPTWPGALAHVIDELLAAAFHNTEQYGNNRVECDHGRLKARLRPMRGLKTERTAQVVIGGHALVQNIRRGHYELGADTHPRLRPATAFDELRPAI